MPKVDSCVENFIGQFTRHMDLADHFIMIKTEVCELQKFLIGLGFNQPIIFEFCRMKVSNLRIRFSTSIV